jgi:hypothetical protein
MSVVTTDSVACVVETRGAQSRGAIAVWSRSGVALSVYSAGGMIVRVSSPINTIGAAERRVVGNPRLPIETQPGRQRAQRPFDHETKSRRPGLCRRLQRCDLRAPPHRALKPRSQRRIATPVDSSPNGWFIAPLHSPKGGLRGLESAITISKGNGLGKPQPQPELAEGAEPQPPISQPPRSSALLLSAFPLWIDAPMPLRQASDGGMRPSRAVAPGPSPQLGYRLPPATIETLRQGVRLTARKSAASIGGARPPNRPPAACEYQPRESSRDPSQRLFRPALPKTLSGNVRR